MSVTVVVPCLNEQQGLAAAHASITAELGHHDLEIVYVDDGSTDDTLRVMRVLAAADPRVKYVSFSRNYGFDAGFSAGFRYAAKEWVLQLDADLQFPPEEAGKLLAKAAEGYDAVYGVRANRDDPVLRKLASRAFHLVGSRVLRVPVPEGATTFRVVRTAVARRAVDAPLATPYFMATVPLLTDRCTTVKVAHRARQTGRSGFRLRWLLKHAFELYVGFSARLAGLVQLAAWLAVAGLVGAAGMAAAGVPGAAEVALTAGACGALGLAGLIRYVLALYRRKQSPALFCVREANFRVRDSDHLYGEEQRAARSGPPPVIPVQVARRIPEAVR